MLYRGTETRVLSRLNVNRVRCKIKKGRKTASKVSHIRLKQNIEFFLGAF